MEQEQQTIEATADSLEGQINDAPEDNQPAQLEGDSKEAMYSIDGENIPLSQIKEWRGGYMKDADYRKKTSEISESRKEWDTYKKEMDPYKSTIDYLNERPDLVEKVNGLLQESYNGETSTGQQDSATPPPWAKNLTQRLEDIELDRQIGQLKNNPAFKGKLDDREQENELLQYADKFNIKNLEVAAKSLFYDNSVASANMAGQDQVTEGLKAKANVQAPVGDGTGMQSPPINDTKNMSREQIIENIVSEDLFGE